MKTLTFCDFYTKKKTDKGFTVLGSLLQNDYLGLRY
jgi:hypothetical protein